MALKQENLTSKFNWLLILAGLLLLTYLLSPILTPFFTAAILAYICNPIVNKIDAWQIGWKTSKFSPTRTGASLIVMTLLFAMLFALTLIVVPLLQKD